LLYKGIETEEDYFYFEGRIAEAHFLRKLATRLFHIYRNFASYLVKALHELVALAMLELPSQRNTV